MVDVINNIRIIEDSLGVFLLSIALVYLLYSAIKLKSSVVRYIPISLFIGFLPLYAWKLIGVINRAFVDKVTSPALSGLLGEVSEIFEAVSGLVLALAIIYILLRLKGVICKEKPAKETPAQTAKAEKGNEENSSKKK